MRVHCSYVAKGWETYGRSLGFSRPHRLLLHCRQLHKMPLQCRSTHSLHHYHRHTSHSRKNHKMEKDPPSWERYANKAHKTRTGRTRGVHKRTMIQQWLYSAHLIMARCKRFTYDNATLFLSPRFSVRVGCAGIFGLFGIRAAWRNFPAVSKLQRLNGLSLVSRNKVIIGVAIIVSTQAANITLSEGLSDQ